MRKRGLGVAAISYDSPAVLKNFAERRSISIPLLSDADSSVIRAFGILNDAIPKTSPFFGVPHPATFMVDAQGVIQDVYYEEDYRKRFTTGAILSEPAAGTEAIASRIPRIHVATSASDLVVRGGERIRLFVTIALAGKVHVYAPGVQGYIPIDWSMEPVSGMEAFPPVFPKAEMVRLEAIKETVPVFQGTMKLQRDVVLGQARDLEKMLDAAGRFTLKGRLRYQACDERRCYVPDDIALTWTFQYESQDTVRVPAELRRR